MLVSLLGWFLTRQSPVLSPLVPPAWLSVSVFSMGRLAEWPSLSVEQITLLSRNPIMIML